MKRIKASKATITIIMSLFLGSCSNLWLHRDQTVDSALSNGVAPAKSSTVPKEQYDELVRKYQNLLDQSKNLKAVEPVVASEGTELNLPLKSEPTVLDPSELVNQIDSALPDVVKLEGVDALKSPTTGPAVPTSYGVQTVNNTDDIDEQIIKLSEVHGLIKVNKFDQALSILKDLENSKEKQIAVRAKMMLGDLLFNQGEFDLASQVYEEVITKYAFSGLVLKALGKLVACSEKLKQPEKQAKYYSLLHDFFEAS